MTTHGLSFREGAPKGFPKIINGVAKGKPKQTIIGNTHGEPNSRTKAIIGGLKWRRLGLSNTLFVLLYSCVCGDGTIAKPKNNYHWGTHGGPKFFRKDIIGGVGVATIGVEQYTFRTTALGCVCGCGIIVKPPKTIIGNTHGDPNS